jgi:hypothetical protein
MLFILSHLDFNFKKGIINDKDQKNNKINKKILKLMKNNSLKYIVIGIVAFGLIFGASSVKAQTANEDYIKALQSLVRVLMQMITLLQQQLANIIVTPITTTTTKPPTLTTTTIAPTNTSLPDLTISSITADKTTLNIGETTKILATEKNIGNNSAGHHYTGIFEDNIETPLGSMEINTIAPGYSPTINANYRCYRAGSHTITALADFIHKVPTGEVMESNENNNSRSITINCIALPTTTTTTTSATAWYTYKRCTDGRCVNHTTWVGPSADQCSTHADCI